MALNQLTIEEMVELTQDWVTPGHPTRGALQRVPGISALMSHIEAAHTALVSTQESEHMQSLTTLEEALVAVDDRHDGLARAAYYTIKASINLTRVYGDESNEAVLEELEALLFPNKLRVVSFSYRDEAGQAKLLSMRIKSDHEHTMSMIPMLGCNLLDTVRAWLAAGGDLGALEDQRDATNLPGGRLHASQARTRWLRAIRAVRTIVELTEVQDPLIEEALGRVLAAELAAERRAQREQARVQAAAHTEDGDVESDVEGVDTENTFD
jgi:hypothetical protein